MSAIPDIPRGIRLNNPGNIRRSTVPWLGLSDMQDDPDFFEFTSAIYGIRAMVRIFKTYQREGVSTLEEAINRWAPPVENNTSAYVSDVCTRCGVQPTDRVDFNAIMPSLIKAVIYHENGAQPYSDADINYAMGLA